MDNYANCLAIFKESWLLNFAINNILDEIIKEYGGGIVFYSEDHTFFILYNVVTKNNFISPKDKTLCIGERFRICIKNNLKNTCSIYVDEAYPLSGLPDSLPEHYAGDQR